MRHYELYSWIAQYRQERLAEASKLHLEEQLRASRRPRNLGSGLENALAPLRGSSKPNDPAAEPIIRDVPTEGPVLRLAEGSGREIFMRPEEAQIGKRVRVRKDHRKAEMRGREGIIVNRWGNPTYPALDVMHDEGDLQLFWYYELELVDDENRGTRRQTEPMRGRRRDLSPARIST